MFNFNYVLAIFLASTFSLLSSNVEASWKMFLNDVRHTGRSLTTIPDAIEPLWFNQSHNNYQKHFSVAEDGTLYMTCDHYIYAINQNDGSEKWHYIADNTITGTAAIDSNGNIYFGSADNNIHSLTSSGTLRWKFPVNGDVLSSVVITSSDIIYATTATRLYKLLPDGSSQWQTNDANGLIAGIPYGSRSTPAVDSAGNVYVVNSSGLFSINQLGSINWSTYVPQLGFSSPAIGDDGVIYCAAGHMANGEGGYLHAFDPVVGNVKWSYHLLGMPYLRNPTIGQDGTIYITADDYWLYAINPNGTLKWKFLGDSELYDCLIDANGLLVVLSDFHSNKLYRINPDGTLKEAFFSYNYQQVNFRPDYVIGNNGEIFVGHDKGVWAFGKPNYSFKVDSIKVTVGTGAPMVEPFNDEQLGSGLVVQDGIAIESGGYLTLKSPGSINDSIQNGLKISQERSGVMSLAPMTQGGSNFSLESRWHPLFPRPSLGYGMTFHYPPSPINQVRIGIDNLDAHALSLLGAPVSTPAGTYITFLQISPEPGTGLYNMTFSYQGAPVSEDSITGDIIFRLVYDSQAKNFSATYSLNGGQTFLQPFTTYAISSLTGTEVPFIELEAGSLIAQPVPCQTGDINDDGVIDLVDVIAGLKIISGSISSPICANSDVNEDGKIGLAEVLYDLLEISQN